MIRFADPLFAPRPPFPSFPPSVPSLPPPAASPLAAPPPGDSALTVRQWIELRYGPEQLHGPKHAASRKLCATACNHLRTFNGGTDPRLDAMTRSFLKRWLSWMASATEEGECFLGRPLPASPMLARSTANKNLAHILAALNYAVEEEALPLLRKVKKLKVAKRKNRSWRPKEIAAMLDAAVRVRGAYGEVPAWRFWVALILTAYDTGLRLHSLMSLQWRNFDREACAVLAEAGTQKHDADQFLGVKRRTALALEAIRTADPRMFPWPLDRVSSARTALGDGRPTWSTLRRHFKRDVLGPAGLPIAGDKPFHRFRRTSATQVKKGAGRASATEQLGHSDPRVTDLYLDAEELGASRGCDQTPDIDVPALERQLRLFE